MSEDRHYDVSLDAGEPLGDTGLVVLHKTGEVAPEGLATEVAAGGAGVVYRALSEQGMQVAVKLLSPKKQIVAEIDSEAFRRTFDREILTLSEVTHTRVAKILFSGTVDLHGEPVPYYAMEFIEGTRFDEFIQSHDLDGLAFLDLVDQVLDGLEHLHERRIMHADLKGENILVREQFGHLDAKIVDLGVAKALPEVDPPTRDDESDANEGDDLDDTGTYFYSSRKITRVEWRPRLGKRITHAELREMFPSHDMFALGVLIREALDHDPLRLHLRADLGASGLDALAQVRDRLLAGPGDEYYRSVSQLRRDWEKIHPRYLSPLGIPELALGAQAQTSVATPLGLIDLTERAVDVLNHPMMQRLRRLPQLELVALVYPGATHTRLLHSLSTFDATRRFVLHLLRDPTFRLLVEPPDVQALLVSALCHDVGHYPLSHMFEDWSHQQAEAGDERTVPTDDDLFNALVDPEQASGGPFKDFADAAGAQLPRGTASLHDTLFSAGRFPDAALESLRELSTLRTPSQRLLRGIVDSSIDADKVAYLLDDSTMTGVRYGLGVDLDALFAALRAPRPEDLGTDRVPLIALNDKGLPAAEQMVLARYWMYRRVYWHHTNRALMAMVKYVISMLAEADALDMPSYFERTLFTGPPEALGYLVRAFDDQFAEDGITNPLHGLNRGRRDIYKRVATFAMADAGSYGTIYRKLASRTPTALLAAGRSVRERLEAVVGGSVTEGEVLIEVPLKDRGRLKNPPLIYLQKEPDKPRPLDEASPVVNALVDEFDKHVRKARVFLHPSLMERVREHGIDVVRAEIVDVLRDA